MKTKLLIFSAFLVGLLMGSAIAVFVNAWIAQRTFAENYALGLIEQVYIAKRLHLGMSNEMFENSKAKISGYVEAINREEFLRDSPDTVFALQQVRAFYECVGTEPPKEISGILVDLPPLESNACEINTLKK